tara:strand:+ start:569 stop:997 length:429 start_codon:yes stop_codon:yes gene_type:complete
MKTFKEHAKTAAAVGSQTSNSPEDSNMGAHNIQDESVLKRVNAFVGSIADKEYINPQQAVDELKEKLGRLGLSFEAKVEGDKGSQTVEVKQFGGRFGKDTDSKPEDVINDDGISHKKEGGLKLEINHETMSNNTSKVFAKLV